MSWDNPHEIELYYYLTRCCFIGASESKAALAHQANPQRYVQSGVETEEQLSPLCDRPAHMHAGTIGLPNGIKTHQELNQIVAKKGRVCACVKWSNTRALSALAICRGYVKTQELASK